MIAEALDLLTTFSNSFSGSSLSTGTAIPTPQSIAIYDIYQSYCVSPIMITLLSLRLSNFIIAVPSAITSSPNSLYVNVLYGSLWSGFSNIQGLSANSFIDFVKNSLTVL